MLGRRSQYVAALAALLVVVSATAEEFRKAPVAHAQELMERVDTLFKEGHYAQAIPIAEQAVAIREKVLGPEHPDTATSINYLGRLHRYAGNYSRAEPLLKRGLAIREKVRGPNHPDTADSLNNLGALYYMLADYNRAEALYQRALDIREKTLGHDHADTAISLNNLAGVYREQGDFSRAEIFNQRALAIREKLFGSENRDTAESLMNLALVYADLGAFTKSETLFLRALAVKERTVGPEHRDTAFVLSSLARLYLDMGEFSKAELNAQRAFAIDEKVLGPQHPEVADTLFALACVYSRLGAYDRAEVLNTRALAIQERAFGAEHPFVANTLDNFGSLSLLQHAFDKSEFLFRRALAIDEKTLGAENPRTVSMIHNLGDLFVAKGDLEKAKQQFERTVALRERMRGRDHPYTATSLQNLGTVLFMSGSYAEAEPLFRRALRIREQQLGPEQADTAVTLASLGALRWAQQQPGQALDFFERAQEIQSKNAARMLQGMSDSRRRLFLGSIASDTYKYASFSVAVPGRESATLGLNGVLRNKGSALDSMSDSFSRLRQSARPEDAALFEQLSRVAGELSALTYRESIPGEYYLKRVQELNSEQERLEAAIAKRSIEFQAQIKPVTTENVSHALPDGAALIEWFRYVPFDPKQLGGNSQSPEPRYVAFVLKRNVDPVAIDMGEAQSIDSLIHDFRLAASNSKRNDSGSNAVALYKRLLKPLTAHLSGVSHLLVSPDGALNLLPMSALINEHGEYLAQQFEISYLTSGRDLLRVNNSSKANRNAIVMADPSFGTALALSSSSTLAQRSADLDRSGLIFKPLASTNLEAKDIKNLLGLSDSDVFLGDAATEARLKNTHKPRILHVASHGFFLSDQDLTDDLSKRVPQALAARQNENPLLRSGLALSGANARRSGPEDDGILTALEVAQLDLQGTELVVFSACDSGVGDIQNGEGVYGLRRALVLAGAQTQVTSLWKVSDEATRKLMSDFYQGLLKGEGRSAALRHAQLAMLANPEFSHPYYWASFVPIGNWTPLPAMH